jgi:hypothetical protein
MLLVISTKCVWCKLSISDLSLMRYVSTPVWHNGSLAGVLLAGGITNGKVRIKAFQLLIRGCIYLIHLHNASRTMLSCSDRIADTHHIFGSACLSERVCGLLHQKQVTCDKSTPSRIQDAVHPKHNMDSSQQKIDCVLLQPRRIHPILLHCLHPGTRGEGHPLKPVTPMW